MVILADKQVKAVKEMKVVVLVVNQLQSQVLLILEVEVELVELEKLALVQMVELL